MFKVNNKDTSTSVFIVDFEQVNTGRDGFNAKQTK